MANKIYQKPKQQGFTPSKKEKKKNTRKVAGIVLLCLMAFWSLASILGVFGFVQNNCKTAKADSVQVGYKFNSSNIYTVCAQLPVENWNNTFLYNGRIPVSAYTGESNRFINFRFNAESGFGDFGIRITFDFISYQNNTPSELHPYLIGHPGISSGVNTDAGTVNGFYLEENETCAIGLLNEDFFPDGPSIGSSSFSGFFEFYISPGFNCDVVSARYYGEQISDMPVATGSNVFDCANYFYYYDSNGNYLRLTSRFTSNPIYQNQFIYKDRYYYLTSETTGQIQFNLGKEQGVEEGKQIGYKNGYDVGYTAGKNVGFNDGVASANNYSFLGLMGAIVDAPISAISGLFNFNILGINLWTFFTGLLTCALIIAVIRLIL